MKAQWPEFRSCFGICSLRVGVYVIATIGLILHGTSLIWNCLMLTLIIHKKTIINDIDCSTFPDKNISQEAIETLTYWTTISCVYYGMWLLVKFFIFISYAVLFYGIWKSKQILLKIYIYTYTPFLFTTLVNACVFLYFVSLTYNILIVAILITNTYLMLIVRSTYREMSGKRRFIERSIDSDTPTMPYEPYENPPEYSLPTDSADNSPHCNSCTCIQTLTCNEQNPVAYRDSSSTVQSPTSSEIRQLVSNTPQKSTDKNKVNFKEEHIIYDRNQLQTSHSSVIDRRFINMSEIPSSSNFDNNADEVKKNIEEVPVIFDQSQLNVGTSPLFENMSITGSPIRSNLKALSEERPSEISNNSNGQFDNHKQIIGRHDGLNDSEIKMIKIPRPKTLDLKNVEKRTKVFKFHEIPVIYNLHQLNNSSTPVTENFKSVVEEPATLIVECKNMNMRRYKYKSSSDDEQ